MDEDGRPVTLEAQDRSLWDQAAMAEARALLEDALADRRPGPFQIEAAISAVHCAATRAEETDWREIAALYEGLEGHRASPVVRVNRAFAASRAFGTDQGLTLLAEVEDHPALRTYPYLHLVRGVLLEEAGRREEARAALEEALRCAANPAEREQIEARLEGLRGAGNTS
jgi:RNA polymerase sigma-70 factor (ECF subfamily)